MKLLVGQHNSVEQRKRLGTKGRVALLPANGKRWQKKSQENGFRRRKNNSFMFYVRIKGETADNLYIRHHGSVLAHIEFL